MEPPTSASVLGRIVIVLLLAGAGSCALVHKTIESDDGDVIDCVDFYDQPALKHASDPAGSRKLVRNKMFLQAKLERSMKDMTAAANASTLQERHQTWRKRGSCPAGTVPIRRASSRANPDQVAETLSRLSSPPFGRPGSGSYNLSATQLGRPGSYNVSAMAAPRGGQVEVAAAYATNGPYLGARADIPYWKVNVHPGEFSMNYILVGYTLDPTFTPSPTADPPAHLTNQIAVGLAAWPSLYGDSLLRLFVYYTNDGGVANNCFNLDCGGFHLKEGSPFALGASWSNSDSQVGGQRYGVTVSLHKDPAGGNWWVSVMDQVIGYYPETVFSTRFHDGIYVEMGGRVLNTRPGGVHTTTPMGNGMPACAGWRFAATIMGYYGVNFNGVIFNDNADRTVTTTPSCYGANPLGIDHARGGSSVSYGGPGGIYCDHQS